MQIVYCSPLFVNPARSVVGACVYVSGPCSSRDLNPGGPEHKVL